MLSTHYMSLLSFILYIHDVIYSFLKYCVQMRRPKLRELKKIFNWDLNLSVFDSKVIAIHYTSLILSLTSTHSAVTLSYSQFHLCHNFCIHFCFF